VSLDAEPIVAADSPPESASRSMHALLGWRKTPAWAVAVGVIIAALLPLITGSPYLLGVLILFLIYAIHNQAWNLTIGFAGAWNFGQLAFFAAGGYGAGIAEARLGAPWWAALLIGALVAVAVNVLMCIPSFRLRGIYVCLFTWSFAQMMMLAITNDTSGLTGGVFGLADITGPFSGLSPLGGLRAFYWLALVVCVATALLIQRLLHSPFGAAFLGLRDARRYAVSLGVSYRSHYFIVTSISACLSGVAGALYAFHFSTISPSVLITWAMLVLMIVLGGLGTVTGPILGTFVVVVLTELVRGFGDLNMLILGVVLLIILALQPGGLTMLVGRLWSGVSQWMNAPQAVKERAAPQEGPLAAKTQLPDVGSPDAIK
jgi:branched-chain amino acid transport system permease protein